MKEYKSKLRFWPATFFKEKDNERNREREKESE